MKRKPVTCLVAVLLACVMSCRIPERAAAPDDYIDIDSIKYDDLAASDYSGEKARPEIADDDRTTIPWFADYSSKKPRLEINDKIFEGADPEIANRVKKLIEFEYEYGKNPFLVYYHNMLINKHGLKAPLIGTRDARWRPDLPSGIAGIFELTSGAIAIETALQQETMKHESIHVSAGEKKVPVSTLKGPEIKPHNFRTMIGNRKIPAGPESSRIAPFDWIYASFPKINNALDFFDYMDSWGGSILDMASMESRMGNVKDRIMTTLGLRINKLLRPFYGLCVDEFALAVSDPYIIEGTDIAVYMKVKSSKMFDRNIKSNLEKIRKEIPGCVDTVLEIEGFTVAVTKSPCGRVSSYRSRIGDLAVFASSETAVRKVIACSIKKAKTVADNLDFQYLLTANYEPGKGYLYIGDDFVSKMIDPAFKIAELRRVNCWGEMRLIQYALTAAMLENDGRPVGLVKIMEEKYLTRAPFCPDGGTFAVNEKTLDISCSVHGHIEALTHLSSLRIDNVTEKEASLFKEFADNYFSYYSHYIDPIGISVDVSNGVCLKVMILPILEEDAYEGLLDFAGGTAVNLSAGKYVFDKYGFNLGIKARYFCQEDRAKLPQFFKREIDRLPKRIGWPYKQNILDWMGPDISLHVADFNPIFFARLDRIFFNDIFNSCPPFFLRIQVVDKDLAREFFSHLFRYIEAQAQEDHSYYQHLFSFKGPLKTKVGTIFLVSAAEKRKEIVKPIINFTIGITDNSLFFSLRPEVVSECMAAEKAGESTKDIFWDEPLKKSMAMLVYPKRLERLAVYADKMLETQAYQSCGNKRYDLDLASGILELSGLSVSEEKILNFRLLDSIPECPDGGKYSFENGSWTCTLHKKGLFERFRHWYSEGFSWRPTEELMGKFKNSKDFSEHLPALPPGSPLKKLLESLAGIEASLLFTEDGISTTVRLVKSAPAKNRKK